MRFLNFDAELFNFLILISVLYSVSFKIMMLLLIFQRIKKWKNKI